jgi:NADPH:quinone reductase-like Zn-dependent oxidoreductase
MSWADGGFLALKAIYFEEHGGPEVLEYGELPDPEPGPGEALVSLKAAALNRVDIWVRNGWPGLKLPLPHIPGSDGAGEVVELGKGVTEFEVGDRVVIDADLSCGECEFCRAGQNHRCRHWNLLGETVSGTDCELIALPERNLLRIPDGFGYGEAAAAALVFMTAWHSLMTRGNLKAGETVLVVGSSGGVNSASIQIAKLAGAKVLAVGSNGEKLALAERLGADVLINRQDDPNWSKAAYLATDKRGVDVVIDNVGASTMISSMRAARKGGRILTVGNTGGPKYEFDHRYLFAKHLSILGSSMAPRADFDEVMSLVFAGRLQPVIDKTFALKDARAAHERLDAGEQMGKIVLAI